MSDNSQLEQEKLQKEIELLELDIVDKRRWWRHSLIPWVTTIAAVVGLLMQMGYSTTRYEMQQQRALDAELAAQQTLQQAENSIVQANSLLADIRVDLQGIQTQVQALMQNNTFDAQIEDQLVSLGNILISADRLIAGRDNWSRHLSVGRPQPLIEKLREGYAVGYDARLKIPAWTQYEITSLDLQQERAGRRAEFQTDLTLPEVARSELADYRRSGFDRGHLAPAGDSRRAEMVMGESALLSNVAPQVPAFNRGVWLGLELAIRQWTRDRDRLMIISGPLFNYPSAHDGVNYQTIGDNKVAVPNAYFKIVADVRNVNLPETLAFIYPNIETLERNSRFDEERFRISIDELETLTGMDFLSSLSTETQLIVESRKDPVWSLSE